MRILNEVILAAGDMSDATITTASIPLDHMGMCTVQAVYTGSPVGSLKLQANVGGATWSDYGSAVAISAAGNTMFHIADIGFSALRAVYTKTSGTGSLAILVNAKGF